MKGNKIMPKKRKSKNKELNKKFGEYLRLIRIDNEYTMKEIAEQLQTSIVAVHKAEVGEIYFKPDKLEKLAIFYGIDTDNLLDFYLECKHEVIQS
jgi:transcriptional regulator with XRE-family HTH domain